MARPDSALDGARRPHPSNGWAGFVALVLTGYLAVTLGLRSTWSAGTFERSAFQDQYTSGVYAPRVLGRELALALGSLLERIGVDPDLGGLGPQGATMFPALVLLNGVALVVVALLVRSLLLRHLDRPAAEMVALGAVALTVASLHVVTPYDLLALVFVMGALTLAGRSGPALPVLVPAVVVAGVATRESALVAVAALVATSLAAPGVVRRSVAIAAAVAGGGAYVVLRVGDPGGLTDGWTWSTNTELGAVSAFGLVMVGLALVGWRWLLRSAGCGELHPTARRAVALTWLLCGPYLLTSVLVGYWYEGLRLVLPVVLADLWVRVVVSPGSVGSDV